MKLAVVTWLDACVHWGDHDIGEVTHEPSEVIQAGWLVRRDAKGITLAFAYDREGLTKDQMFIPAPLVKSVRVIRDA